MRGLCIYVVMCNNQNANMNYSKDCCILASGILQKNSVADHRDALKVGIKLLSSQPVT